MFRKRLRQSILLVLTIAFFIMALPAHLFHGAPTYKITDLGIETEPLTSLSNPPISALNDRGEIAGTIQVEGVWNAFFWSGSGGRRVLELPDSTGARALHLNNHSVVTGVYTDLEGESRSFAWKIDPSGQDSLAIGFPGTAGMAIDDQGRVLGGFEERGRRHAFIWSASEGMSMLEVPEGRRVVGAAMTPSGEALITARARERIQYTLFFLERGGALRELGQEFPLAGGALDMNAKGEWVGARRMGGGPSRGPWGARKAILGNSQGEFQDLPAERAQTSAANGINDKGQIVGMVRSWSRFEEIAVRILGFVDSRFDTRFVPRFRQRASTLAVLWKDGELIDLNDLIPLESGWIVEEALDINNSGQIAGSGKFEGKSRLFLMSPIERIAKAE
ncbi:MAG: hypothetical protein GHCLOJNM_02188 [bacterium]|nr:hypothetical protein [bacterium]